MNGNVFFKLLGGAMVVGLAGLCLTGRPHAACALFAVLGGLGFTLALRKSVSVTDICGAVAGTAAMFTALLAGIFMVQFHAVLVYMACFLGTIVLAGVADALYTAGDRPAP